MSIPDVLEFLRRTGYKLSRPEVLGLPSNTGQGLSILGRARDHFREALIAGEEEQCQRLVFDLYLSGKSACEICDQVVARAFHDIGTGWKSGEIAIYQERRGIEIATKLLHDLGKMIGTPDEGSPVAIGGSLEHDPYGLPTTMVEIVLREMGWFATSFGTLLPASTFEKAVQESMPRLLWVSVSNIASVEEFVREYERLYTAAISVGSAVVVGGRALTGEIRQRILYSAFCDNLNHLVAFAKSLHGKARPSSGNVQEN